MDKDLEAALDCLPTEMQAYSEVRRLAKGSKYSEALEALEVSSLTETTKLHLKTVLESGEQYVVDRTFIEMDARIMQALCWGCWRE